MASVPVRASPSTSESEKAPLEVNAPRLVSALAPPRVTVLPVFPVSVPAVMIPVCVTAPERLSVSAPPSTTVPKPPVVNLTVNDITTCSLPGTEAFSFTATAPGPNPCVITAVSALLDGNPVGGLTIVGLGTTTVTVSGTYTLTARLTKKATEAGLAAPAPAEVKVLEGKQAKIDVKVESK